MGAVAKSYMRKGFLIWGNAQKFSHMHVRRPLVMTLQPLPSGFLLLCMRKILFSFLSVLVYTCTLCRHLLPNVPIPNLPSCPSLSFFYFLFNCAMFLQDYKYLLLTYIVQHFLCNPRNSAFRILYSFLLLLSLPFLQFLDVSFLALLHYLYPILTQLFFIYTHN